MLEQTTKVLDEFAKNVEAAQAARQEGGFAGSPALREALRSVLGTKEQQVSVQALHALRKQTAALKRERLKAFRVSGQPAGSTSVVRRYPAVVGTTHFLQDYIQQINASGAYVELQSAVGSGSAAQVSETDAKPERTSQQVSMRMPLTKVAVTETYTEEALRFVGQEQLVSYLELQLSMLVEEAISNVVAGAIASTAVAFNPAPYANSVPSANFIDALVLAIAQERETTLYNSVRSISDVGLVVLPRAWWQRLGVLKDGFGRRLYNDWAQALMEDIEVATHVLTVSTALNTAFIVRPFEYYLATLDDVIIYNQRIYDDAQDKNLHRITAEVFVTLVATPRASTATQTYARSVHLVSDVNTINKP